jgi:hypothetical protein
MDFFKKKNIHRKKLIFLEIYNKFSYAYLDFAVQITRCELIKRKLVNIIEADNILSYSIIRMSLQGEHQEFDEVILKNHLISSNFEAKI